MAAPASASASSSDDAARQTGTPARPRAGLPDCIRDFAKADAKAQMASLDAHHPTLFARVPRGSTSVLFHCEDALVLRHALALGADPNVLSRGGRTPIEWTFVSFELPEALYRAKILLRFGSTAERPSPTAVHPESGALETIAREILAGVNRIEKDTTPGVAWRRRGTTVSDVFSVVDEIALGNTHRTPLRTADESPVTARDFFDELDKPNGFGEKRLETAVRLGRLDGVRFLLHLRADALWEPARGVRFSPLHPTTAEECRLSAAALDLIGHLPAAPNRDIGAILRAGPLTPLALAAHFDDIGLIRALIGAGADPANAGSGVLRANVLHFARSELAVAIIVSATHTSKRTSLLETESAGSLVEDSFGMCIATVTISRGTPLFSAVARDLTDDGVVSALLAAGADPGAGIAHERKNAFHAVRSVGMLELLDGADPTLLDAKDADGLTPAATAKLRGLLDVCAAIEDHVARRDEQNDPDRENT
jgi:hypothetical protein